MRSVLIDNNYFNLKSGKSANLVTSLKKLNSFGLACAIDNSVFNKYPLLKEILKAEGIKFRTVRITEKGSNPPEFKNIETLVNSYIPARSATVSRKTKETDITVKLNLDGDEKAIIGTGIGFFDHMLEQIARHANIQLEIKCNGDLYIDEHHTVEDTGLVLGEALRIALGDKKGIQRYGFFIPMDESASLCTIDLSGRSYLNFGCEFKREFVGSFPVELTEEFFRAVASSLKANILIKAKGKNDHHKIESVFKAFAKALNEACRFDERNKNSLPSTKGVL